jgi:phosphohistidine phosphatase
MAVPKAASSRLVWLLRHAKTVTAPPAGGTDHERRLAPRGRRDASALGRRLGEGGDRLGRDPSELPTLVLTSSATRTLQTTELVLEGFSASPTVETLGALYTAGPDDVIDQLRLVDDEVRSVMVVGHNPTAQALSVGLIGSGRRAERRKAENAGFPTCALGIYRFDAKHWRALSEGSGSLLALFTPPF